jgi:hypothetical protein
VFHTSLLILRGFIPEILRIRTRAALTSEVAAFRRLPLQKTPRLGLGPKRGVRIREITSITDSSLCRVRSAGQRSNQLQELRRLSSEKPVGNEAVYNAGGV